MDQEKQEWYIDAIEKFQTRHGKLRGKHWNRFGSGSKAEADDDEFREQLKALQKSELFQRIKHRYVENPNTSDDIALINLISIDYCAGSLEFLLTETSEESMKINPSPTK